MSLKEMITDEEYLSENKIIKEEIKNIKKNISILEIEDDLPYLNSMVKQIAKEFELMLDIKENIGMLFNLFIKKVVVSKINDDRHHVNLNIFFNFKRENQEYIIN